MHYTKPSYYDKFHCTAGDCPDTCCQGWQIIIDPESMEKYKSNPDLWSYVKNSIDYDAAEEGPCYRLKDKKCTHLTEDGLCEMQVRFGFDALCGICKKFPRHTEEYDSERELSIDLSCPEGASLILNDTDGSFQSWDDDLEETDDYEDFDYFLYTELTEAREQLYHLLNETANHKTNHTEADRSGAGDSNPEPHYPAETVDTLMNTLLSLAELWQKDLDRNQVFAMNEPKQLQEIDHFDYDTEKRLFSRLFELEILRPEWTDTVNRTYETVFRNPESYEKAKKQLEACGSYIRRVLRYMIYVYFDGAVYDGRIYAKLACAVYCVRWTFFVYFSLFPNSRPETGSSGAAAVPENGKNQAAGFLFSREKMDRSYGDLSTMIYAVYMFSREVEHSDLNIKSLENWFDQDCPVDASEE